MSNRAITLDGRGCGLTEAHFAPQPGTLAYYKAKLAALEAEMAAETGRAEKGRTTAARKGVA
ncbi:MAG: hypothetical protein K2X82_11080 [Gemmataceae bacterium]|nr:hypothetical protein [Gemmataceae bacterium]